MLPDYNINCQISIKVKNQDFEYLILKRYYKLDSNKNFFIKKDQQYNFKIKFDC